MELLSGLVLMPFPSILLGDLTHALNFKDQDFRTSTLKLQKKEHSFISK